MSSYRNSRRKIFIMNYLVKRAETSFHGIFAFEIKVHLVTPTHCLHAPYSFGHMFRFVYISYSVKFFTLLYV